MRWRPGPQFPPASEKPGTLNQLDIESANGSPLGSASPVGSAKNSPRAKVSAVTSAELYVSLLSGGDTAWTTD